MRKIIASIVFLLAGITIVSCGGGGGGGSDDGGGTIAGSTILNASPSNINIDASGSQQSLSITANCDWSITGAAEWLTVSSLHGNNNATITLSATQNTSADSRSCTLTLQGGNLRRTVTVTQSGAGASLAVSPTSLSFDYKEGTKTFDVSSNSSWTVSSDQYWCTVSPQSGSNNGSVTVKATQNNSENTRTATITVSGGGKTATITITQNGGAKPEVSDLRDTEIKSTEATFTFSIKSAEPVTQCGLCYSKTSNTPTVNDSHIEIDASTGSKTGKLTGLEKKTVYYVRAYAVSAIGTTYSDPVTITTKSASPEEEDNGTPNYSKNNVITN